MSKKIVQTAGRTALGNFAPEFAHYNDDVLFGENWNSGGIDIKIRCIITVVSLSEIAFIVALLRFPRRRCWRLRRRNIHFYTHTEVISFKK